ncbi:MAG: RNA polymerase factor sigma-32 [Pseudomonadota bacterium]
MNYPVLSNGFGNFLNEVKKIKILTPEREFELAVRYKTDGDIQAAQELTISHLPFVVKIAFQYRHYMLPVQDLVQEGAMGLMKAIKRFDPYLGYRLASFAVWWIKAYIKNFIIRSWNLVKLGTTTAQRKLFYRIGDIGEHGDDESRQDRIKNLAEELNVKEDEVIEVEARMRARDYSLDEVFGEEDGLSPVNLIEDQSSNQEQMLMERESESLLTKALRDAMKKLNERENLIIRKRYLGDTQWTLQEIGNHFGVTRERARQLESRALGKLRAELGPQMVTELLPA